MKNDSYHLLETTFRNKQKEAKPTNTKATQTKETTHKKEQKEKQNTTGARKKRKNKAKKNPRSQLIGKSIGTIWGPSNCAITGIMGLRRCSAERVDGGGYPMYAPQLEVTYCALATRAIVAR